MTNGPARDDIDEQAVAVAPDPRWRRMGGNQEDLAARAESWRTHPDVPEEVAAMLATARRLFVHGYFAYEFHTVAVAWSLFAVEAALRARLGTGRGKEAPGMGKLVGMAQARALLTPEGAEAVRAGAGIRNGFAHPGGQFVYTPAMAAEQLAAGHVIVADLYSRQPR